MTSALSLASLLVFGLSAGALAGETRLGQCVGGVSPRQTVELAANQCVVGHMTPDYLEWGGHLVSEDEGKTIAKEDLKTKHLILPNMGPFEVSDVDAAHRKVLITYHSKPGSSEVVAAWVNSESLQCEPERNVSSYSAFPVPKGMDRPCPEEGNFRQLANWVYERLSRLSDQWSEKILARAEAYKKESDKNFLSDRRALLDAFYKNPKLTNKDRVAMFEKARGKINGFYERAAKIYGPNCDGKRPKSVRYEIMWERGERSCRTFRAAKERIERWEGSLKQIGTSPDYLVLLARDEMEEDDDFKTAAEDYKADNAINMNVVYYALGLDEDPVQDSKLAMLKARLNFVEKKSINFGSVETDLASDPDPEIRARKITRGKPYDEVFGGYLYGAYGKIGSPVECAGFALNYVLGMHESRGGKSFIPNVEEFNAIHRYLSNETKQRPPTFAAYTSCFKVVDLRKGEVPIKGDFVASSGHIVIVDHFDIAKRDIVTIESASGDCQGMCQAHRPIYESSCSAEDADSSERPIRSDVRVMRFAPQPGCPIHIE